VINEVWDFAWDTSADGCGGGLWWTSDGNPTARNGNGLSSNKYKATITNTLWMQAAVLLHKLGRDSHDKNYLGRAKQILSWLEKDGNGEIFGPWGVYDGRNSKDVDRPEGDCSVATGMYTYNSGVPLYALKVLADIESEQSYIQTAVDIADRAISYFADGLDGILNELHCSSNDNQVFKGVFIYNLQKLMESKYLDKARKAAFRKFIINNAKSCVQISRNNLGLFGGKWDAAPTAKASVQAAGATMDQTTYNSTSAHVTLQGQIDCTKPSPAAQGSAILLMTAAAVVIGEE